MSQVNCNNRGAIPFPPAARSKQQGLLQALAADAASAPVEERERPFLGDEIFDMGVDNNYNNGDVMMPSDSPNVSPMYAPLNARKEQRVGLALNHWNRANALLESAEKQVFLLFFSCCFSLLLMSRPMLSFKRPRSKIFPPFFLFFCFLFTSRPMLSSKAPRSRFRV